MVVEKDVRIMERFFDNRYKSRMQVLALQPNGGEIKYHSLLCILCWTPIFLIISISSETGNY